MVTMVVILWTSKMFVVNTKDGGKRNVWCQQVKHGYTWTSKFEVKYKLFPF